MFIMIKPLLTKRLNFYCPIVFFLCLSITSPKIYAATECFFSNYGGSASINSTASPGIITPLSPGAEGWITAELKTNVSLSTTCNAGPDGQKLQGKSTNSPTASLSYDGTTDDYNIALYSTTVRGIYYAVKIVNNSHPPMGYLPNTTGYRRLYNIDDNNDKAWLKGVSHTLYIALYQKSDYVPGTSTTISPQTTGNVGQFLYGEDSGDRVNINVNANAFNIQMVVPNCTAALGSKNASGNTVNLGDVTVAALHNNATNAIPFTINLTNCINTNSAKFKLTATRYDSNTGYLKNNGTDMGVGVKITNDSNQQLKADGSNTLSSAVSGISSATINLNAQLLKLSDSIQTGNFSAQGVFQIDYN
jgi:hypothetical protein